ncbi:MAG: M48 family metalloprotease [Armatimonadetes bacterium]|nr:M48 family metalloprotease [Armatimonadota bacterium]MCX7967811.1 M48 family metalloprotease [Armatimonadota bacterium]MDW8142796.1 M48 family metalloprotease [Armatimonadota bacterium]
MRLRQLGVALLLPLILVLAGCDLDREIEKLLGAIAQTFWELGFERSDDPLLTELTESVGKRVASVSPRKDMPIKFKVLNLGEVNAVALPNGRIYVFRGMLETADTEDELAAVLAHEVGHVAGRHSLKQFRLSLGIGLLADLLNLNKQSAIVQNLAGLAATLYELGYSRQHERDADNYALKLALLAGYDPKGSVELFDKFAKREGKPARWLIYLSTHPAPTERLERAKRANSDLSRIYPDLPAFAAHTLVGTGYAQRGLYRFAAQHYEEAIKSQPRYVPALLGLAQAKEAVQDLEEARKWYERVLEIEPQNEEAKRGLERLQATTPVQTQLQTYDERERFIASKKLEAALSEWEQVQGLWTKQWKTTLAATNSAATQAKNLWSQMRSMPLQIKPIHINFGRTEKRDKKGNEDAFSWRDSMRLDNLVRTRDEVLKECARTLAAMQVAIAELESVFEDTQRATSLWQSALRDWKELVLQGHKLPDFVIDSSNSCSRILFRVAVAAEHESNMVRDVERQLSRAIGSLAEASNLLQRQSASFVWTAETKLQFARSSLQSATADLHSLLARTTEKRSQVDKALLAAYQTRLSALEAKTPATVTRKIAAYHLRVSEEQIASVREKTPDIGATAIVIAFAKAKRVEPENLSSELDFSGDWVEKLVGNRAPAGVRVMLRWLTTAWERDWDLAKEGKPKEQNSTGEASGNDGQ